MVYKPLHFLSIYTLLTKEKRLDLFTAGVTVNIHSPKKALPITYLLANKYSLVFFPQDKRTPGSVYLLVNKYCFGKYLLPFLYSVSIIGPNSHRFTPKPSLCQIKSKFSPK